MPTAAPRICARCGGVIPARTVCPCRPAWEGSPQRAARGRPWARFRLARLRANPICQHDGCRRLATVVDHMTPLAEGGAEYDWHNTQCLCREHATQKDTQDALRGKRRRRGNGG